MLKAELRAKMFQLDPDWAKVEDILTGDFFGALDYLPRNSFLSCFLERVVALNETARTPELSQVDWSNVKLLFWPRVQLDEEQVEPDVVVVSNRWTIVIEVKLDSGLGVRQPWREYQAGQSIARKHGLPSHAVYYLVVARSKLDVGQTFADHELEKREELLSRTLYLCWWQAAALIGSWHAGQIEGPSLEAGQTRLMEDLAASLRRRRSILFAGFTFPDITNVVQRLDGVFCPPVFVGFLRSPIVRVSAPSPRVFLNRFDGFLKRVGSTAFGGSMHLSQFRGFAKKTPTVYAPSSPIFASTPSNSFLHNAPASLATRVWYSSS